MVLQFLKKLLFKTRKHDRYLIHKGKFIIMFPTKKGTKVKWKVQAIDLSLGGAAFIYEGSEDDLDKIGLMKLFNEISDKEAMRFETVSDVKAPGCSEESEYRRRGVKFQWGGVLYKHQINDFVKEYGVCAC